MEHDLPPALKNWVTNFQLLTTQQRMEVSCTLKAKATKLSVYCLVYTIILSYLLTVGVVCYIDNMDRVGVDGFVLLTLGIIGYCITVTFPAGWLVKKLKDNAEERLKYL